MTCSRMFVVAVGVLLLMWCSGGAAVHTPSLSPSSSSLSAGNDSSPAVAASFPTNSNTGKVAKPTSPANSSLAPPAESRVGYTPPAVASSYAAPQTAYSYSASGGSAEPSASTGYAFSKDNNYTPSGDGIYNYNTVSDDAAGYEEAAAATGYAAEPYPGYYDESGYYGYYGDEADRQAATVTEDPNAVVDGTTKKPEEDHTADFLRQILLFSVAIIAVLYGFFVTPFIVSGLGLASGLLPLFITAFAPSINGFLRLGGLNLCTTGPPPALFPGGVANGRSLLVDNISPVSFGGGVGDVVELLWSWWQSANTEAAA